MPNIRAADIASKNFILHLLTVWNSDFMRHNIHHFKHNASKKFTYFKKYASFLKNRGKNEVFRKNEAQIHY